MKTSGHIFALLLALLTVLFPLAACGGKTASENAATTAVTAAAETAATTADPFPDKLPRDLGYNGAAVSFLYREEIADDFYAEAMNGEIVNDAIFETHQGVEERLDFKLDVTLLLGHLTTHRQSYADHVSQAVLAGDCKYDWVDLMIGLAPKYVMDGTYRDISNLKYVDYDQPWYISGLNDTIGIDGKLLFLSGDAALGYLKQAFCIYFNQRIANDFGITDLYKTVEDGKWTIDKLIETAAKGSRDVNGDGVWTMDDELGFMVHDSNHPRGFMTSTGIELVKKGADGTYSVTFGTDRDQSVCTALYKLKKESEGVYFSSSNDANPSVAAEYAKITALFNGGKIFMMSAEMHHVASLFREMEDEYGILPYPKFDEKDDYHTSSRNIHNSFAMPVLCSDPDRAGAVMEAISSAGYQNILPVYFETVLKYKYSRDRDSARMFDLIHDTMMLGFTYTYNDTIGNPMAKFFLNYFNSVDNFASAIASNKSAIEASMANYIETIGKNVQ